MKGIFITFEGPDGSGKSTQIRKLAEYLQDRQWPIVLTREPGGTFIGDAIRHILLDPSYEALGDETEALLYAASRAQHIKEVIMPALNEGKIVLCDRFVDASIAYQGYGLELPLDQVIAINQFATHHLTPHRTYMLDIAPEIARARMLAQHGRGLDRIEQKHFAYHQRVREGFLRIYKENIQRICLIDGARPPEVVFEEIAHDASCFIKHKIEE
ncbi:dTMP kinase [Camelliibacillus cellulosilyticus]|uniref:Thymidylate kinase n=1 Tax=Camelliibacillus cellulosilyticus TaxID=2174486 RepID=A0ABV9GTV9_9BACL